MSKRAKDLQIGDVIDGVGHVVGVRITASDYKAPIRSRVGLRRLPGGKVCPPFKPTPVVEVTIAGRDAREFFWPKQKVEVAS